MNKSANFILNILYVLIFISTTVVLFFYGKSFYDLPLEERFYHPDYENLKPSGFLGHGLGVLGTSLILLGVTLYWIRKRSRAIAHWGYLEHWLEFHIFLCSMGTVLILFHTSFKFGGIVSIGFWSLALVFLSGIIGRYIYLQIPKTIEGDELNLREIQSMKLKLENEVFVKYNLELNENRTFIDLLRNLELKKLAFSKKLGIIRIHQKQKVINRKIRHLTKMKQIFRYWHVIHLPFALIMLLIMLIHVGVVVYFGYWWILK